MRSKHENTNDAIEAVEDILLRNVLTELPPSSPSAFDDDFSGGGSIDIKWTATNNPSGGDAFNQSDFKRFLTVGLVEQTGTDNFANAVRLHQSSPPSGVWDLRAKLAIAIDSGFPTEEGEFAAAAIYVGNSGTGEFLNTGIQFNNAGTALQPLQAVADKEGGGSFLVWSTFTDMLKTVAPAQFYYVRIVKATADAYTSTNTYRSYISSNGLIWQQVAEESRAFTTAPNEIGMLFRRPKSQSGSPHARALVDWFRLV